MLAKLDLLKEGRALLHERLNVGLGIGLLVLVQHLEALSNQRHHSYPPPPVSARSPLNLLGVVLVRDEGEDVLKLRRVGQRLKSSPKAEPLL